VRRLLTAGLLVVLACAVFQVSVRALAKEGSGRMAWIQAQLDEQQGSSPIASLRRAVALSPREAAYHSQLGLVLEAQGDLEQAERELVLGTQLSRKYEPRWDLLNFYFRRARWDRFWPVATDALPVSWGDRTSVFELALHAQGGQARLQAALPLKREVRFNYAVFLISRGDMASAAPFISELAASAMPEEKPDFLYWIDLLLEKRMVRDALATWRALGETGDPFPWRPGKVPGVTIHPMEGDAWQILFDGNEPEHCVVLESVKAVDAGLSYQLAASLEEKLSPAGGLLWRIETLESSPRVLDQSFTTATGVEAVRIRLEYQRPQGSVRAEGEVRIHSVQLQKTQ
jgi:tetratricopeptide (TPR) repeat protein